MGLVAVGLVAVFALEELVFWNRPLTFTVGAARESGVLHDLESAPDAAPLPLRFSDGTLITLAPRARARVVAIGRAGAQIVIEAGQARVEVAAARLRVPGESPWRVHLGPFSVEAESARFEVGWQAPSDDFELAVLDGSVEVSGCDGARSQRLAGGQGLRAACRPERWTLVAAAEVAADWAPEAPSPLEPAAPKLAPPPESATSAPAAAGAAAH